MNPVCAEPTSGTDDAKTCPSCNASLTLRERYRSLRLLGQGGFGRTFLAVDESESSKPRCVVKQLFPQQQNERQRASRLFRQEAQRLRSLEAHSQIPDLIDYFEIDDQQYLVQEFIDGKDLAVALKSDKTSSPEAVVELLGSLLPVLQFMHEHQVIHRDIKPANIIRRDRDQQLFLVDLGAAKVATGTALARTGTMIGSAEYTAPEQLRGKAVFASDIYSLGMTCLHLLTGVSPFNLYNADEGRLAWQDYLKVPINQRLSQILAGMTAVATKQRYGSAKEVLLELKALPEFRPVLERAAADTSSPSRVKTFIPDAQIVGNLELPKHPELKSPSQSEPVKLQVGQQRSSLSIEIQEKRTTSSTPLSQKKLLLSDEPQTFLTVLVSVLSGELPVSAMWGWMQQEAPPDFKGDLLWSIGRTALILTVILSVPALIWVTKSNISALSSQANTRENIDSNDFLATDKSSDEASHKPSEYFDSSHKFPLSYSVNYDSSNRSHSARDDLLYGNDYNFLTIIPIIKKPQKGTEKLLEEYRIDSVPLTGRLVHTLEIHESQGILLAVTTESDNVEHSSLFFVEVWELESGQKRFDLSLQSGIPIVRLSFDGETILTQSFPLLFTGKALEEGAKVKAYDSRTGTPRQLPEIIQNSILQGVGPLNDSGEATVAVELLSSTAEDRNLLVGQETGELLLPPGTIPTGFSAVPQKYKSLLAFGSSPISGGSGEVLLFDWNNYKNPTRIIPYGFGDTGPFFAARTGDLKFDSKGKLYIGNGRENCDISCLEIYDFYNGQPENLHIPARIPAFDELFFTQDPAQILLYIASSLDAKPQLQLWDIDKGHFLKRIELGDSYGKPGSKTAYPPPPVKLSADGTKLYTVHPGEIKVWDFQALLGQE